MMGLIVKDIKILFQRKIFFVLMFAFAVFFSFDNDASFGVSYFTIICTIFSSTTISYDEAGNCFSYLMALPVTKSDYVKSKYALGIIFAACAWVLSAIACGIVNIVASDALDVAEYLFASALILPVSLIVISITIPTTLKFGQQGGIIASAVLAAVIVGVVMVAQARAGAALLFEGAGNFIEDNPYMILVFAFVVAAVVYMISFVISKKVMDGKEF